MDLAWFWERSQSSSLVQALGPMHPQEHKADPSKVWDRQPQKYPAERQKQHKKEPATTPWENASPAADHCSLYEFTRLIFLIWWAKLLSADIQHPLMKLQVLSTF